MAATSRRTCTPFAELKRADLHFSKNEITGSPRPRSHCSNYDQHAALISTASQAGAEFGLQLLWTIPAAAFLGAGGNVGPGYVMAQGFGWPWGANKQRLETARFSGAFTLMLGGSLLFAITGVDPLRLTLIAVGLTVTLMPIVCCRCSC